MRGATTGGAVSNSSPGVAKGAKSKPINQKMPKYNYYSKCEVIQA